MAELIHTFTGGKMNKDLDERLVPNSEYRDALNLEIASSENSQVGSFQNIKGNKEKNFNYLNETTGKLTTWGAVNYISNLSNPVCIGARADENSDEIYWFIASDNISVIASYNSVTTVTLPLVVDTQNILKFSKDYLITGINVLEGMLIWTDNQTEPKKIIIKDWVPPVNFLTHSQIYGRDFIESDLTVIKKYPLQPPTIESFSTSRTIDGTNPAVTANVETQTSFSFVETINGELVPKNSESGPQTLTWQGNTLPYYKPDDVLLFSWAENDALDEDAVNRCTVLSVIGSGQSQTGAIVIINSVGVGIENQTTTPKLYDVTLEQETPFFEMRFARFGYRYKYKNNELSAFSPFSNPAFMPGEFNYSPEEGYNLAMVNNIRQLTISNFIPSNIPINVTKVDILYKATNNANVYVVDTFTPTDPEWQDNSFNIKTEIITSVVNANQLLRPYDNVPRKALAQEISANRLIYGNYTQNFNLIDSLGNPTQTIIDVATDSLDILDQNGDPISSITIGNNTVAESVKSIRTYQVGVAYMDKYGRTTPVFTSSEATAVIEKPDAQKSNKIKARIASSTPYYDQQTQFPYFKYYIKETSQEYYNLCLDRYYNAEDGNVWLSFPSAERNKVDEETFIILKKQHDNDEPVTEKARYKIIAIENEAPQYLKETKLSKGTMTRNDGDSQLLFPNGYFPIEGAVEIAVEVSDNDSEHPGFNQVFGIESASTSGLVMRITDGFNISNWYKIGSIGKIDISGNEHYTLTSSSVFKADMNFTSTDPYGWTYAVDGLQLEIASVEIQNKPEFTGRFFVKVNQDVVLTENILAARASDDNYIRKALGFCYYLNANKTRRRDWRRSSYNWLCDDAQGNDSRLFIDRVNPKCARQGQGTTLGATEGTIEVSWSGAGAYGGNRSMEVKYPALHDALNSVGSLFRFIDAGGNVSEDPNGTIYRITAIDQHPVVRTYACNSTTNSSYDDSLNTLRRYKLTIKPIEGSGGLQWDPVVDGGLTTYTCANNSNYVGMEFLTLNPEDDGFSSANPAIFETEPKEAAELDIYYEVPGSYDTATDHGVEHTLDFFNCYSFANGVESDRIRDDYNQPVIENGVKASATLDEPYNEEHRSNGLIFSQIFNSVSGVNGLNQFIQAESITKDVNPEYGSVQKLYSRDTNLVTLCENKSMKILANKDALFNADGSSNVTSNQAVLGQTITFQGEFGIATNPESFAEYGFRMYYTDANRGTVIRLSNDGITEVSDYGMHGFFSDNLKLNSKIVGTWDADRRNYNVSLSTLSPYWQQTLGAGQFDRLNKDPLCNQFVNTYPTTSTTISFKEDVNGWTSRKTYIPEAGVFLNGIYYTFKDGRLWEHNINALHNTFYNIGPTDVNLGPYYESSFNVLFNENPSSVKGFKTINYSGTDSREYIYKVLPSQKTYSLAQVQAQQLTPNSFSTTKGWYTNSIITDLQEGELREFVNKEGKYFNYIRGLATFFNTDCDNNVNSEEFNVQGIGRASVITAPTLEEFTVTTSLDDTCFTSTVPPLLNNQSFTGVEDTLGTFQIAETNTCASGITFNLINDATNSGTLVLQSTGSFTFNPDLNFYGDGGSFTVEACCGGVCSAPATISLNILPVAEDPYFTTSYPSLTGLVNGDVWTYNPIGIDDPDHTPQQLFIALPQANMPSWMNQPAALNDGTGNWYIPPSTVTGGAGAIDFTMTVVDPDGNTGTQQITGDTIEAALLNLEFLITTRSSQAARSYTDPATGLVTAMASTLTSRHACNRGTYRIVGNTTDIARAYVGNMQNVTGLYDTFTLDSNGFANSPTGDVQGTPTVPSAVAQGTTSTALDSSAPYQKYITSSDTFESIDRYNLITIDQATADTIVANTTGPNPEIVSFGLIADTFNAGGALNTHGDGVYLQVFKSGVEVYSQKQPNNSAVTINVLTGEIL